MKEKLIEMVRKGRSDKEIMQELIKTHYIKLHSCFIFFGDHRRKLNWTSSQMTSRSSNQQLVVAS
jgi:hypothetical protein